MTFILFIHLIFSDGSAIQEQYKLVDTNMSGCVSLAANKAKVLYGRYKGQGKYSFTCIRSVGSK